MLAFPPNLSIEDMKLNKFLQILTMLLAMALTACGGTGGPTLGAFPDIAKTMGDVTFPITAPSSDSPGGFTYTSSNTAVATIAANNVTILSVGTSTITATQAASGKWGSGSVSAVLTVKPRACISPAVLINGICTALTMPGTFVTFGGHLWMPVSLITNWTNANDFCTNTTINGQTGWSLPDNVQLNALSQNLTLTDKGWLLGSTWTSIAGTALGSRKTTDLKTGIAGETMETISGFVTCVK